MKKQSTSSFIGKAKQIHGDKYDYSKINYINNATKVEIICKEHGPFWQAPSSHLSGSGCKKCANQKAKTPYYSTEEFIEMAKIIHGESLDYSKINYSGAYKEIILICPIHGEFTKKAFKVLAGQGCPKCNGYNMTTEDFIKEANKVHNNKYNYSESIYETCNKKIKIICPEHGEFYTAIRHHLAGRGCPNCKESRGDVKIREWLDTNNIKFETQKTFEDCKLECNLRFDFYLPDYNLCIEFDGRQHYIPFSFSPDKSKETMETNLELVKKRDAIKNRYCKENKINLLRVSYIEIKNISNILKKEIELYAKT